MRQNDNRPEHLAWIESALRRAHPDLHELRLSAQSHYGKPDAVAFVEIFGVDADRDRRRKVRGEAGNLLRALGYRVDLVPGRDVYDVRPNRPTSAHDELDMLRRLQEAIAGDVYE